MIIFYPTEGSWTAGGNCQIFIDITYITIFIVVPAITISVQITTIFQGGRLYVTYPFFIFPGRYYMLYFGKNNFPFFK